MERERELRLDAKKGMEGFRGQTELVPDPI